MPTPLALSLANTIRQEIRTGSLREGRALPPERDLAKSYNVSRGVVRQAVDSLAREGWLVRQPNCRPVVARGRFTIDRTKADHINVWLWPSTSDFVASSVFRGIQDGLKGSPYRLVVGTARTDGGWAAAIHDEVDFLCQVSDDPTCAGALLWPIGEEEMMEPLQKAQAARLPLVFVDREPPLGWAGDVVCTDNYGSAREVAIELYRRGHRKLAILSNRDTASSVRERISGFLAGLKECGGSGEPSILTFSPLEGETDADAYRRTLARLPREDGPTAVFCINDSLALGALEALEQLGFSVPGDLSVAGFDGLLRWIPGGGRLASAHQDFRRIGELAIQLLLRRIAEDGDPDLPRRHLLLPAPFVARESVGAPNADRLAGHRAGREP